LRASLERVRDRIARACRAAGRDPSDVQLVAVTKGAGAELAAALAELGQLDLGENRAGELEAKASALSARGLAVRWHFLGHLQRNKARRVVARAAAVHSLDSVRLLRALERLAEEGSRPLDVYLEVKLVEVEERSGFAPAEVPAAVELAASLPHLRLAGLMTMAPLDPRARPGDVASQALARATFASLRELAGRLPRGAFAGGAPRLSMGMSSDLEAAIHEGAHVVRVGTALFEPSPGAQGEPEA
jgi:pyridoxal phosphate enzyme (YggS family)